MLSGCIVTVRQPVPSVPKSSGMSIFRKFQDVAFVGFTHALLPPAASDEHRLIEAKVRLNQFIAPHSK